MQFNNIFIIIFLIFLFLSITIKITLDIINYRHRKKNLNKIPEELKGMINEEKLLQINRYSNAKLIYSLVEYFFEKIVLLIILFSGLIPYYYNILNNNFNNIYILILLFFGGFYLIDIIMDIPFSLYFDFVIEKKFNFNKMTFKIWIGDLIKKIILTVIIGSIILIALTFFLYSYEKIWWILLWAFFFAFSMIMQIIYPTIIAPIFNKFKTLENKELKQKIELLLKDSGLKLNGIFEMDASKRSTHSNAYFTGIGKSKRIVLYDSLLKNHTEDEILAILAHEIGHYVKKHVLKNLISTSIVSLLLLFICFYLINNIKLYTGFGFVNNFNINEAKFVGLYLLTILAAPIAFFFSPITSAFSRKHEREADKFSYEKIKSAEPLINSLKKLNVDNLSNIYPADIYSWFYYSHPPLFKRIKYLKSLEKNKGKTK